MNDPFVNATEQLNKISKLIVIPKDILVQLQAPERILEVSIPVKMDDGTVKVFTGWRSQFNSALGPYKGGIRFHQDVSKNEVKALSMWMTWKTSALSLPLGGGKGGIKVDPKQLSEEELERLSRGYIQKIYKYIGPDFDIPAPDVNTNGQIMLWMMDEYSKLVGKKELGVITGKPVEQGGSKGRDVATAQGGFYVVKKVLAEEKIESSGTNVAIQGFGNAGSIFAKLAEADGFKIVAVSDSKGGIYNEEGLDISAVEEHKKATGSVKDLDGAKNITSEELLELPVKILVPAALENQITKDNAPNIKADIVLELANGPVTPEADAILEENQKNVVPDILANAGGVTVSYFEQVQNKENKYWEKDEVLNKLKTKIEKSTQDIIKVRNEKSISMRMAAYTLAVQNVVTAMSKK